MPAISPVSLVREVPDLTKLFRKWDEEYEARLQRLENGTAEEQREASILRHRDARVAKEVIQHYGGQGE